MMAATDMTEPLRNCIGIRLQLNENWCEPNTVLKKDLKAEKVPYMHHTNCQINKKDASTMK